MRLEFLGELISEASGRKVSRSAVLEEQVIVLFSLAYFSGLLGDERIRGGLPLERFAHIFADMVVDGLGSNEGDGR